MVENQRTWRSARAGCGGLSIAVLLLATGSSEAAPAHHDADPVRFVDGTSVEWDPSKVLDLEIKAEISFHDPTTHKEGEVFDDALHRMARAAPELRASKLEIASLRIPKEQRTRLEMMGEREGRTLIVERLIATASIRGGTHPFMTQWRRFYVLETGKLRQLSQKQWDEIVDPIEIQLSSEGHSYRYQRGRAEIDPPSPRVEVKSFDTAIKGARPTRDPWMEGKRGK